MTTLADQLIEKEAELAEAKQALAAARSSQSWMQGDKQVQRAQLRDLELSVARLAREVRELRAMSQGARNPMMMVPSWR